MPSTPSGRTAMPAPCWCCLPAPARPSCSRRWPLIRCVPGTGCSFWRTGASCWNRLPTSCSVPPALSAPWKRPNPPAWTAGSGWWWAACRPCSAPPGWNAFPGITSAPSSSTRPTTPSPTVTAASWTTSAGPRCLASPPRRTAATCAIWARCSTAWPLSTS